MSVDGERNKYKVLSKSLQCYKRFKEFTLIQQIKHKKTTVRHFILYELSQENKLKQLREVCTHSPIQASVGTLLKNIPAALQRINCNKAKYGNLPQF